MKHFSLPRHDCADETPDEDIGEVTGTFSSLTDLDFGVDLEWLPAFVLDRPESRNDNIYFNPLASEASREVANLTERKNPHTPVYGVKEFVCLSVTLT